jgi:hypothetical protein
MSAPSLHVPLPADTCGNVEFYTIEIARLIDGGVFVTIAATTSPREGELITRDVACHRAQTLDEAMSLVRRVMAHC